MKTSIIERYETIARIQAWQGELIWLEKRSIEIRAIHESILNRIALLKIQICGAKLPDNQANPADEKTYTPKQLAKRIKKTGETIVLDPRR